MTTAILITARLKSTRLPMKVIKPILGKPMICYMIDRLKLAKRPEKIVICTSPISQDDPLEEIANQESIDCFRGHPEDVLQRLTDAAALYNIDTVISCTADNPFVDPEYIDYLVDFHIQQGNDFTNTEGLPLGTFAYALAYPAMVRSCQIKDEIDTEVWGGYFTQTGLFKVGTLSLTDMVLRRPDLRFTVDTSEDFQLVEKIFEALYVEGQVFSLRDIVQLCGRSPDLLKINAHIQQKPGKPIRVKS